MTSTLSPAAMIVRAGMMHDDGDYLLNDAQMSDLYRALDCLRGDEAAIDRAWEELAGDAVALPPVMQRITWTLWIVFADGSRSLLDMLDWEPGYNGSAKDAWRYAWGVFRAQMRDPSALGAASIQYTVQGR